MLAGLALPAFAEEVTFVMNNHHPNAVEVQLYSDSRDHVWPDRDEEDATPVFQAFQRFAARVVTVERPHVPGPEELAGNLRVLLEHGTADDG